MGKTNSVNNFHHSSLFRKRCRTEPLLEQIKAFIEEENLVEEDNQQSMTVNHLLGYLLGYLLYRTNHVNNKKLAKVGAMIMNNQDQELFLNENFDCTDAVTLMHDLSLSKEQMRTIRKYLMKKGIFFPNTTDLLEARKKLKPVIKVTTELDEKGVSVDYTELVKMTTASIFDIINEELKVPLDPADEYHMFYKEGGDGAGSQSVWKSKSMQGAAEHMFQYSIVPLRLEKMEE